MRWIQVLFLLAVLVLPAVAGREIDNRNGLYNGDYIADTIEIREPDKEPVIKKKVHIGLRERKLTIVWSDELMDVCRADSIYTTGYKTEITASNTKNDIRYFVTIEGSIGTGQ